MANPTLLSVPLCRDAEKNTIPVTDNGTTGKFSEQYGWQGINSLPLSAGGKAVERLDFNGVLALLGGIDYMTQRGYTFEYDNSLPYVAGCIVVDPLDGKTYRCINDVPIGASNPSNDAINWVSHDIADYVGGALRSKAYNVGDTSTLAGIPAGYFLECTTAGTTGATAPVITPPVTTEQTITDGTVVWTVRKCFPTSGGIINGRIKFPGNETVPTISALDKDKAFLLCGGDDFWGGSNIILRGAEATNKGININSIESQTNYAGLHFYPDGTLEVQSRGYLGGYNSLSKASIVAESIRGFTGYRKTSDGMLVQWGKIPVGLPGVFHVSYPLSFATGEEVQFVATLTRNTDSGSPSGTVVRMNSAQHNINDPTGCSVYVNSFDSTGFYTMSWMAIGKG